MTNEIHPRGAPIERNRITSSPPPLPQVYAKPARTSIGLAEWLQEQPGLQDGWFGKELVKRVDAPERVVARHSETWLRFRRWFESRHLRTCGERVLTVPVYVSQAAWELWSCGLNPSLHYRTNRLIERPEAAEWWASLAPIQRADFYKTCRHGTKRPRLLALIEAHLADESIWTSPK